MDPVHKNDKDGKWYFWDETRYCKYGPYETEEECRHALDYYVKYVLG